MYYVLPLCVCVLGWETMDVSVGHLSEEPVETFCSVIEGWFGGNIITSVETLLSNFLASEIGGLTSKIC